LQLASFLPWRVQPHVAFIRPRQDHRHGFGMDRLDDGVSLGRQEAVDKVWAGEGLDFVPRSPLYSVEMPSTIEPCAMCSYAIRESRIGRVMFGLRSPVMGGNTRWNILTDRGLSSTLPEVFAPPPDVPPRCLHREVQKRSEIRSSGNLLKLERYSWRVPELIARGHTKMGVGPRSRVASWARASVVDRLWLG
jgi:hypothetical protein